MCSLTNGREPFICTGILNDQDVHFKYLTILFVSYTSIWLNYRERETREMTDTEGITMTSEKHTNKSPPHREPARLVLRKPE